VNKVKQYAPHYGEDMYLHRAYIEHSLDVFTASLRVLEELGLDGIQVNIHVQHLAEGILGTAGRHATPNTYVVQLSYVFKMETLLHELRHVWQMHYDAFDINEDSHFDLPWEDRPCEHDAIKYARKNLTRYQDAYEKRRQTRRRRSGTGSVERYMANILKLRVAAGYMNNHEREPRTELA